MATANSGRCNIWVAAPSTSTVSPREQRAQLFDVPTCGAHESAGLPSTQRAGRAGPEAAGEPTRSEALDRRDGRGRRHHVAEVRHEHCGAQVDLRVLGDQCEPHPDVLVQAGGVEQPEPVVAEVAGEPGELDVSRPRGDRHRDPPRPCCHSGSLLLGRVFGTCAPVSRSGVCRVRLDRAGLVASTSSDFELFDILPDMASPRLPVRTLARVARLLERSCGDLTLPQYRLLAMIGDGSERATALAGRLALTKPSVSTMVDALVDRGSSCALASATTAARSASH